MARPATTNEAGQNPFVTTFRCSSCGLVKLATVSIPPRARSKAAPSADRVEEPAIGQVLARFECPQCAHIERPFRPIRSAKLVVLGLLISGSAFLKAALDDEPLWNTIGIGSAALTIGLFWRWLNAAALIRSSTVELSNAPVPGQLAGSTCKACSRRVVTNDEGVSCATCGASLHRSQCAERHAVEAHGGQTNAYR
jgi:predicted RNA-binding Zn-ribbon protein involved in translation (DUF1610 family)